MVALDSILIFVSGESMQKSDIKRCIFIFKRKTLGG